MKQWVSTSLIEPADLEGVVTGRFGSNMMFVSFSQVSGWSWVFSGGTERIEEPEMLFLEEAWTSEHPRRSPIVHRENPARVRKKKSEQLSLGF